MEPARGLLRDELHRQRLMGHGLLRRNERLYRENRRLYTKPAQTASRLEALYYLLSARRRRPMKTVAIIQARMGSTRLPQGPLGPGVCRLLWAIAVAGGRYRHPQLLPRRQSARGHRLPSPERN